MIHYSASKISKVLLALLSSNKEKNFWGLALMCVKGKKLRCDFANIIIITVIDNNVTAIEHKKREKEAIKAAMSEYIKKSDRF